VLRFRLMVKRGHRGYGPQASEGEAQHGPFCWIRRGRGFKAPDQIGNRPLGAVTVTLFGSGVACGSLADLEKIKFDAHVWWRAPTLNELGGQASCTFLFQIR
jgi:hypothetical protein